MDHAAISEQVRDNLHYLAGDKTLLIRGQSVPYAPAEINSNPEFSQGGGGVLDDYSFAVSCHIDDFHGGSRPDPGDIAIVDGDSFEILRTGRVKETGEFILYFGNPDA